MTPMGVVFSAHIPIAHFLRTLCQQLQSVHKSKFRQKSKQEQAAASKLRMEERGEKLERAKDKLAKQKPPKKPGPVRRIGRAAGGAAHGFVHGKI